MFWSKKDSIQEKAYLCVCRRVSFGDVMPAPTNALGVFTICPTPFDEALKVDTESIKSLVDFLLDTGITGLAST